MVFQWFSMVANHWSNDGMVTIHRSGLATTLLQLLQLYNCYNIAQLFQFSQLVLIVSPYSVLIFWVSGSVCAPTFESCLLHLHLLYSICDIVFLGSLHDVSLLLPEWMANTLSSYSFLLSLSLSLSKISHPIQACSPNSNRKKQPPSHICKAFICRLDK